MTDLFVTGTDTGVGKTVVSALLTAALDAFYWKPIQTGVEGGQEESDRETVIRCAGIEAARTFPENYVFDPPVSPHLAARLAGVTIDLSAIVRPTSEPARLIIEGAGGVLVPINHDSSMVDLMAHLGAPIVIVTRTSLGTINHTLLTVKAVREAGLTLAGIVMVGEENRENRNAIEDYGRARVIGWIPPLPEINRNTLLEVFDHHFEAAAFDA